MHSNSRLVHWFLSQVTYLDALEFTELYPVSHSNVTVDPSGKLWAEREESDMTTFLDGKEGGVHCAVETNKTHALQ